MLEVNVLEPGLSTYRFGPDGTTNWIVKIPECFIAECGAELAMSVYSHLAHSWLLRGELNRSTLEGELWELMDGSDADDRVITSRINTILQFWDTYSVIMNRHFLYSAPVKEYRDITGVVVMEGTIGNAIWTIDSTLLTQSYVDYPGDQPIVSVNKSNLETALHSKYF